MDSDLFKNNLFDISAFSKLSDADITEVEIHYIALQMILFRVKISEVNKLLINYRENEKMRKMLIEDEIEFLYGLNEPENSYDEKKFYDIEKIIFNVNNME